MSYLDLDFRQMVVQHDGYSTSTIMANTISASRRDHASFQKYIFHKLIYDSIHKPKELNLYISARVKRRFFSKHDLYLLVADCDSITACQNTSAKLTKLNILHYVIESSPGHYWIIGDYINTKANIQFLLEEIPGVDTEYVRVIPHGIVLRAFPKAGFKPTFINLDKLTGSKTFVNWIKSFKEYWDTDMMNQVQENLFMNNL